jgi:hypothetical protein
MDEAIRELMKKTLVWLPTLEIGYFPVTKNVYDDKYFDKYVGYEDTEIGKCLNEFRISLVNRYTRGRVLDIGVGCGTFIKDRGAERTFGYDINPKAVNLLKDMKIFYNPYEEDFERDRLEGITFFDSLEHIKYPGRILRKINKQFVFVSIPIFRDLEHLLNSKHLRDDEHFYYFTRGSFIKYMGIFGFKSLETSYTEIKCGREDIGTFVFRKEKGT